MSHIMSTLRLAVPVFLLATRMALAAPVAPKMPDVLEPLPPSAVKLGGFLGERVTNNEKNRLLIVDEDDLLAGFRHRPGRQAWIGEHVGKFLHAASLAWANTQDPKLREKIDRVAAELIKTQEPDGYLGTYVKEKRFGLYPGADWDVWVHKYDLLGLLAYHEYTGKAAALEACRKIGDLLINTFGPGKKSILSAGTHMGMAATSVLEPMVNLYRATGDEKYLDFAKYIVASWNEPGGPKILKTLSETGKVNQTANGKAYEMMSNLVGLCEMARATGDKSYLVAVEKAWADVVANQRYITGTASYGEHFHADHDLPNGNGANLGETCVTTTWIQLNWQLLRLTGDAKYGDEIERSYYNHLAGAQLPDGSKWCYYTPLEGTKPYGNSTNCCLSSGPRAMALLPQMVFFKHRQNGQESLWLNLWESADVQLQLNGKLCHLEVVTSGLPLKQAKITWKQGGETEIETRMPQGMAWRNVKDNTFVARREPDRPAGWANMATRELNELTWITLNRQVSGKDTNNGRAALEYGPLVLAYEEKLNPDLPPASRVTLAGTSPSPKGDGTFEAPIAFKDGTTKNAVFVPFAQAGATGGRFAVWLRAPGNFAPEGGAGRESRSREGNVNGSISDGDAGTFVVTFDGAKADADWFAVAFPKPTGVARVVFAHGKSFHDGGWFDASAGKPQVQVQKTVGGAWETVGALDDYPATTATDNRGLKDGQTFTLRLNEPHMVVAVRVIGKPSSGDGPNQAFASCGELSVYND